MPAPQERAADSFKTDNRNKFAGSNLSAFCGAGAEAVRASFDGLGMRIRSTLASLLLVACMTAAAGFSAESRLPQQNSERPAKGSETETRPVKAASKNRLAWEEALGHVRLLAAKFQQYRDTALAGRSLASLASVVCQYDKTSAPALFSQALELVHAPLWSEQQPPEKERFWAARSAVISSAARCDPQLAEQLNRQRPVSREGKADPAHYWSDLRAAHETLSTNEAAALQFAQNLSRQVSDLEFTQLEHFSNLLWKLRQQRPSAADQLFLQTLERLRLTPGPALRAINALGNYVFAPQGAGPTDAIGVAPFGNQNDERVYLFDVLRSGATPVSVEAYLRTTAQVLSALSPSGQKEAGVSYAIAHQLLQRSREIAPDLTSDYEIALQHVSPAFSDEKLKSQVSAVTGSETNRDRVFLEEDLEKAAHAQRRDEIRLMLFARDVFGFGQFPSDKQISKAEVLVAAVEEPGLRSQMISLLAFRKVQMALESKDLQQAQALSTALKSPLHRALAFLGIAQQQQRGDSELAGAASSVAIREVEKVGPEVRPYLLVSAATVGAPLDVQRALRNLEDAVAGYNLLDDGSAADSRQRGLFLTNARKPQESVSASSRGLVEFASTGDTRRHFPLNVPGLSFDLSDASRALRFSQPEHLSAILFALQSEARQGPALAAAATAWLERAK